MSWRIVVIAKRAKLEYRLNHLVIRTDEIKRIHLSEIAVLILESTAISLTAMLLAELIQQKIKVIFCDAKRNPHSELLPYYGSFDTSKKIREQLQWTDTNKKIIWQAIISDKIRQQAAVLQENKIYLANLLLRYSKEVELGDVTNREGTAAKVYFEALFGEGFLRNAECVINAGLNYGYSILLSAFNREIVSNGYLTQLGIFHANQFNQFNLTSDLMEPFRPLVDRQVKQGKFKIFSQKEKMQLVDVLNLEVKIDGKKQMVLNAIKIYCKSVFHALEKGEYREIKQYRYEL